MSARRAAAPVLAYSARTEPGREKVSGGFSGASLACSPDHHHPGLRLPCWLSDLHADDRRRRAAHPADYRETVQTVVGLFKDGMLLILGFYFAKVVNAEQRDRTYRAIDPVAASPPKTKRYG